MLEIYMENSNGVATPLNEAIVFNNKVLQTGCTAVANIPANTVRLNKAGFYSVHIDAVIANNTAEAGLVGIQLYNNNDEVSNAYTAQTSTGNTNLVSVGFDTIIIGYPCHKAVCKFRGRTWTAWYSLDLPFDNGPWKLGGLPGLILAASESRHEFSFVATGIEQMRQTATICFYPKRYLRSTPVKFQHLLEDLEVQMVQLVK